MKSITGKLESGLIRIFRFFSGGVAIVFLLLLITPVSWGNSDPVSRKAMLMFTATYGVIFVYLMIPGLEGFMKGFYLPPVLIAACLIPIAIINAKYRAILATGGAIHTLDDTITVTILLLFPLITTAWQYSYPIVFLFYVVLGFLDPLLIILVHKSITPAIYGTLNASLIRILALGAVGFMITELRELQRRERRALEAANRKLEDYARSSERLAASRERNRIARDLHDTLAHTLSGLAIQLEATGTVIKEEDSPVGAMIEKAQETVRIGLGETRRALKALRASPLEDVGLLIALRRLADDAAARSNTEIYSSLPVETPDWDEVLEEGIYRIVQEALENIVCHAYASKVELHLEGNKESLSLKVEDNGRGFESDALFREERYGLRGMRERAATLKGKLTVNSSPGGGTCIMFLWRKST